MLQKKRENKKEKTGLHPRNKHLERYNFKELIHTCPALSQFVKVNNYNDESIDFFDPDAVMMLNKALLMHNYGIDYWNIPSGYLCPPIPGRADYIHHIADLLGSCNKGVIPLGNQVKCLDIGVGANCIYPIIGIREYGWSFVGSDIDSIAIKSASNIITNNDFLIRNLELRLQHNSKNIFTGIIHNGDQFDLTICNPPFHGSLKEAQSGTLRKLSNLNKKRVNKPTLNFGGRNNELWCEGGEEKFVETMINQSKQISLTCYWFSTLVSKQSHLNNIYKALKYADVSEVRTIPVKQGNKSSRIVAWTYLSNEQQFKWKNERWNSKP